MTRKFRWPALPSAALGVAVAVATLSRLQPALAALPCGTQPEEVSVDVGTQIKEQAGLIRQAPANLALRGLVLAKRRELRQKYEDVEPATIDHGLLWVICQNISKDRTLAGSQQFDEYSNFYRLLSEPIAKAAPAAE